MDLRLICKPLLYAFLLIFSLSTYPKSDRLNIACAANFSRTLNKLIVLFQTHYSQTLDIRVSIGSSGSLATQITHGAPFDLFFSADKHFVDTLSNAEIGYERILYATGELVLYSNLATAMSLEEKMQNLKQHTVAIANPRLAPYGHAALVILHQQKVAPKRVVKGTSVLHAYQYVESGHAQYGFIAKSLLQSEDTGHWSSIPYDWYAPIEQHALRLSQSDLANAFFTFIQSAEAQAVIKQSGYR